MCKENLGGVFMKASARNQFTGTVIAINHGAVNDEIEIALDGSKTKITSVITCTSTKNLGLKPEKKVVALIKASWVILMTDTEGVQFSARNQLYGTVAAVEHGAVNAEIAIKLDSGDMLTAIITEESTKNLEITVGKKVTALIKASHVILGTTA